MCDKCAEIIKAFPDYNNCPYCGESFNIEVKEAVNILIQYCRQQESCQSCLFFDSLQDNSYSFCRFHNENIPLEEWDEYKTYKRRY